MIKLFGQTDQSFTSNGDRVIHALKAKIKKEDNGGFYLELETDLSYANDLTEGRIILAPTPQGEQPFRVSNVHKTKTKISTKCLHVFFDSKNYLIADSYVVDKSCNDALGIISGIVVYTVYMGYAPVEGAVVGIALGLSACGLFSGVKNLVK